MSLSAAFKTICASLGALAGYFFGELDGFFYAVVTMVVIDYITGVMCAVVRKQLSSEIGFRGIFKKIFIFIFIGMAHIIDVQYSTRSAFFALLSFFSICRTNPFPSLKMPLCSVCPYPTDSLMYYISCGTALPTRRNRGYFLPLFPFTTVYNLRFFVLNSFLELPSKMIISESMLSTIPIMSCSILLAIYDKLSLVALLHLD